MNTYANLFALILIVSVGIGIARNQQTAGGQPVLLSSIDRPVPQAERTRKWIDKPTDRLLQIGRNSNVFDFAWEVRTDAEDNIYVWDVGALNVKKFSPSGELIETLGRGRGQGPGEFLSITDMLVLPDGEVWLTDMSNGRLTVFSPEGNLDRMLSSSRSVYRVLWVEDDKIGVMLGATDSHLFATATHHGDRLHFLDEYGQILENQSRFGLVLDGAVAANQDGETAYSPWYFGALARFTRDGEIKFFAETIEPLAMPALRTNASGILHIDRRAEESSKGISWVADEIFVLGVFRNGLKLLGSIDVYSASSARYKYSVRVPDECFNFHITDEHLYTVNATSISKWIRAF